MRLCGLTFFGGSIIFDRSSASDLSTRGALCLTHQVHWTCRRRIHCTGPLKCIGPVLSCSRPLRPFSTYQTVLDPSDLSGSLRPFSTPQTFLDSSDLSRPLRPFLTPQTFLDPSDLSRPLNLSQPLNFSQPPSALLEGSTAPFLLRIFYV